jgi:fructose-1,6-bisphosphatase II
MTQPIALTITDPERMLKYEFVRAIENIALNVLQWLGRGEKELADTAGRDAINGVLKPGRN